MLPSFVYRSVNAGRLGCHGYPCFGGGGGGMAALREVVFCSFLGVGLESPASCLGLPRFVACAIRSYRRTDSQRFEQSLFGANRSCYGCVCVLSVRICAITNGHVLRRAVVHSWSLSPLCTSAWSLLLLFIFRPIDRVVERRFAPVKVQNFRRIRSTCRFTAGRFRSL